MSALVNSTGFRRISKVPPSYYLLAMLLVILFVARPQMLNANVLGVFVRQVVPLGILVLGQLLVMRVKSIDLSGGGVILLINYCISSGIFPGASLGFYVALALTTGLVIGLFNGVMVAKRRVSAVIVTLALSIVLVGFVQYLRAASHQATCRNSLLISSTRALPACRARSSSGSQSPR